MASKIDTLVFLFSKSIPQTTVDNPWFQELERKYNVEAWDIGDVLFEGMPRHPYGQGVNNKTRNISSIPDLRKALLEKNRKTTVLIYNDTMVHCRRNAERVVREISSNDYTYVVRDITNSFGVEADLRWVRSKIRRFKRKSFLGFRNRRLWFWRSVKPPLFALVAGRIREDALKIQGLRTRFVRAHSRDFEHYLELSRDSTSVKTDNFGIFLDGAMAGSSDQVYEKKAPELDAATYYGRLGQFIERMCAQFDLAGFTLALHPSNNLNQAEIKRALGTATCDVAKGNTAELVQKSRLVASHCSSAYALAVLFQKPVVVFCPGPPESLSHEKYMRDYAKVLGRRVNYPDTMSLDMGLDEKAYRRFRDRYVKEPDTPDMSHYKILDNELQACVSGNRRSQ